MVDWIDIGPSKAMWLPGEKESTAIVLPGAMGAGAQPLLWFGRAAAQQHGWSALVVWDEYNGGLEGREPVEWVEERANAALTFAADRRCILIAKSLSSCAAGIAADRALPAIWFTPLLNRPDVVAALRRAEAPSLLVGGTGDPMWDSSVAMSLKGEVHEVEGADHSLELSGDALGSADVLKTVTHRTVDFMRRLD